MVSDSIVYMVLGYSAFPITMVCNLLLKRHLGPYLSGVLATINLLSSYGMFANLGVLSATERELPFAKGTGDNERYQRLRSASAGFSLGAGFLFAVSLVVYVGIAGRSMDRWLAMGIVAVAMISFIQQWSNYHITLLRTESKFVFLGKFNAILAVITSVSLLASSYLFGFAGVILAMVLLATARAVIAHLKTGYTPPIAFDYGEYWELFRLGIPILLTGLIFTFAQTVDSILILHWLDLKSLGMYSIAVSAVLLIVNLSKSAQSVFTPVMMLEFGESNDIDSFKRFVIKPTEVLALTIPLILGGMYLLVPWFISLTMPSFNQGIVPFKILVVGAFFRAISQIPASVLVSMKKEKEVVLVTAVGIAVQVIASWLLIRWGLVGISLATSFSFGVVWFGLFWLALPKESRFARGIRIVTNTLPLVYSVATLLLIDAVLSYDANAKNEMILVGLARCALFLVFQLPLFGWLQVKTGLLLDLWMIVRAFANRLLAGQK